MEITEVRIKLMLGAQDRLLGFCSVTFDGAFVVRDLKIIQGGKGVFVAMPSRKLTDRCASCGAKNQLRACFCSNCGVSLGQNRSLKAGDGRLRLYADIAHPINAECRDLIQDQVLKAYREECVLSQMPNYVCRYDDFGECGYEGSVTDSWMEEVAAGEVGDSRRRVDQSAGRSTPAPHVNGRDRAAQLVQTRCHEAGDDFGEGVL